MLPRMVGNLLIDSAAEAPNLPVVATSKVVELLIGELLTPLHALTLSTLQSSSLLADIGEFPGT